MSIITVGIEKHLETATLTFSCQTKNNGPYDKDVAVCFDMKEFCATRLSGASGKKLSWYQHYSIRDDGSVNYEYLSRKTKEVRVSDPTVASKYHLTFLEIKALRESESFNSFVESNDYTENQKHTLLKFSAAHGSTKESNADPTHTAKIVVSKILQALSSTAVEIAEHAEIDADTKLTLAAQIETASVASVVVLKAPAQAREALYTEIISARAVVEDTESKMADKVAALQFLLKNAEYRISVDSYIAAMETPAVETTESTPVVETPAVETTESK